MKIIVISDIHSNYAAFESAFDTIEEINPDGIIFLGDYVTDFPYPQRTMELLYKCQCKYKGWFIKATVKTIYYSTVKIRMTVGHTVQV